MSSRATAAAAWRLEPDPSISARRWRSLAALEDGTYHLLSPQQEWRREWAAATIDRGHSPPRVGGVNGVDWAGQQQQDQWDQGRQAQDTRRAKAGQQEGDTAQWLPARGIPCRCGLGERCCCLLPDFARRPSSTTELSPRGSPWRQPVSPPPQHLLQPSKPQPSGHGQGRSGVARNEQQQAGTADALFERFDRDCNEFLDRSEHGALLQALQLVPAQETPRRETGAGRGAAAAQLLQAARVQAELAAERRSAQHEEEEELRHGQVLYLQREAAPQHQLQLRRRTAQQQQQQQQQQQHEEEVGQEERPSGGQTTTMIGQPSAQLRGEAAEEVWLRQALARAEQRRDEVEGARREQLEQSGRRAAAVRAEARDAHARADAAQEDAARLRRELERAEEALQSAVEERVGEDRRGEEEVWRGSSNAAALLFDAWDRRQGGRGRLTRQDFKALLADTVVPHRNDGRNRWQ
jgi:hypothetical protein